MSPDFVFSDAARDAASPFASGFPAWVPCPTASRVEVALVSGFALAEPEVDVVPVEPAVVGWRLSGAAASPVLERPAAPVWLEVVVRRSIGSSAARW